MTTFCLTKKQNRITNFYAQKNNFSKVPQWKNCQSIKAGKQKEAQIYHSLFERAFSVKLLLSSAWSAVFVEWCNSCLRFKIAVLFLKKLHLCWDPVMLSDTAGNNQRLSGTTTRTFSGTTQMTQNFLDQKLYTIVKDYSQLSLSIMSAFCLRLIWLEQSFL